MITKQAPGELAPQPAADRAAEFEALFRRHYAALVGFFINRGMSPLDSEDLAQETLLRAYHGYEGFRRQASAATWLFAIALNQWRNHLRTKRTKKRDAEMVSIEGLVAGGVDVELLLRGGEGAPDPDLPLKRALDGELRRLLQQAVEQLPPQMWRCVRLYCSGKLDHEEIAVLLGVNVKTVKSFISQAKLRLMEILRRDHPDLF